MVCVIRKGEDFPNLPNMYRNVDVCALLEYWDGFNLIYLIKQPTSAEINDIETVSPEIRLFEYQKSIFLLARFGECGVDAPFDARRLPPDNQASLIKIRE